jgi:hypothetical protein
LVRILSCKKFRGADGYALDREKYGGRREDGEQIVVSRKIRFNEFHRIGVD